MHPDVSSSPPQPHIAAVEIHPPASPRHPLPATPTSAARRRIGVAVDLSDESAFAIRWSVDHYIRPGDAVIILHVSPTSVLFGADWGHTGRIPHDDFYGADRTTFFRTPEDFDAFIASKITDLAKPLSEAHIPFKIHMVKDHDMKERLCIEVERLGLKAVIMGSRGSGAAYRKTGGKLGRVSDYCVNHCVCPVVVVRYPDNKDDAAAADRK